MRAESSEPRAEKSEPESLNRLKHNAANAISAHRAAEETLGGFGMTTTENYLASGLGVRAEGHLEGQRIRSKGF